MHSNEATSAYREASLETAPPIKIVRLLYQGALRNLERARRSIENSEHSAFVESLHKADQIVSELRFSLDHAAAPELSRQLEELYLFVEGRFAAAMAGRNMAPADEGARILRELLSAWTTLDVGGNAAA